MQLPSVDRTHFVRQPGAEAEAVSPLGRVIPVAPVNPADAGDEAGQSPSVVNRVGQGPADGRELVYSQGDPLRRGAEDALATQEDDQRRAQAERLENPPPVPMYKMLMDHLASLWAASASAVQVQAQVRSQLDPQLQNPSAQPSQNALAAVTYSPSKVAKNEKI